MAYKKNISNESSVSCPSRDKKNTPSTKKKIPKNVLQFESLISEFSAFLISTPEEDLEYELNRWLEKFVKFFKVDACIVNEFVEDGRTVRRILNYSVPDIDITPVLDNYSPPKDSIRALEKGVLIKAEKIPRDLPVNFQGGLIEKTDIKSVVIAPLTAGNKLIGSLLFASYRKRRKWSDDMIRRIKLIGEIIANTVQRMRSQKSLLEEVERRHVAGQKYAAILRTANVGFFLADYESNIIDVNDEYCRLSGYSRDELYSIKIYDLQVPLGHEEDKRIGYEINTFGATHHEAVHKRKDGSLIELDVSSAVFDKNIFYSFMRDITELNKRKREQEERLRFEKAISEFSTALINIKPDDIESELGKWLKKIVELLDMDRCAVNEYRDDQKIIKNLMQYSIPELSISIPKIRETPEGEINELEKGIIKVEKIPDELPEMFHGNFIEVNKCKSLIIVPLLTGDRVFGNLAFTNYRKERKWSDEVIRRIKLIGEIVGNAILRKRSHEALIEEMEQRHMLEKKYTSIIKNASVGFTISDYNQNILDVNDEYCRMSGYTRDELIKMKISDIDFSDTPEKVDHDISLTVDGGLYHHQSRHIRKDGSLFDVDIHSQYSESEGFFFSFVRDVTELNKAREDLEDRLKFEELTSEFSAALINLRLDKIDEELYPWVKKYVEFFEVERGIINEYDYDKGYVNAIATYTVPDVEVPPTDKSNEASKPVMEKLAKGVIIRAEKIPEDLPPIFNEGIIRRHNTKSLVIVPLSAANQIIGNLTFATYTKEHKWSDEFIRRIKLIGEIIANAILRKRSGDALLEEIKSRHMVEEKYTSIIKNASVGFTISDFDQNILDVNDEYCRMSGYTYDELIKMKISDIDYSESPEKVDRDIALTVEGEDGIFHHQSKHIRKDGSLFDVDVHSQYSESEKFFFSFVRDITELNKARKELEDRLKFEELISEFSAALINIEPYKIKNEIENWIGKIVELLDVDMGIVNEYINEQKNVMVFLHYTVPGLSLPVSRIRKTQTGFISLLEKGIMRVERIPEDLPPPLRDGLVEKHNTKSLIVAPLLTGNRVFGNLTFACYKKERSWSDELVRRVKLVGEIIGNAVLRLRSYEIINQAQKELEERLKFEELVSEFSAALINVKIANIKDELNIWLGRFARFLNVDKCCLGEYEDDYQLYRYISTYLNPGLDPQPLPFPSEPVRPYGFARYLKKGETIILENVEKGQSRFPEPLMQKLKEDGTRSILMLPLVAGDVLLGSMLISSMTGERTWPQHLIRELRLVAEIFANALMRDKRDLELDNYRRDLEVMVDERTAQLKEAQKELVLSEKMATLGRLTSTVSHELRNPLGTIRSSVFSVQRRIQGQDEKVMAALDRVERNIRRCDLIIDELLNYSRAHDLKLKPTPIDTWLCEVLEEIKPPEGISIKKEFNSNAIINMDNERFRRSIVNILTNAYQSIQEKDSDEPGYVRIITNKDNEKLFIEVSDNGVGFDMKKKEKIFEPLYSTKTFGVGLGIPITKQIIEQHGWNIDITGEPQKGASVLITIPF